MPFALAPPGIDCEACLGLLIGRTGLMANIDSVGHAGYSQD